MGRRVRPVHRQVRGGLDGQYRGEPPERTGMSVDRSVPAGRGARMLAAAQARGLTVDLRDRPAGRQPGGSGRAARASSRPTSPRPSWPGPDRARTSSWWCPATGRSPGPRSAALLGVNKIKFPDAAEALAATGYERGTITPIGSEPDWPVLVDERWSAAGSPWAPGVTDSAPSSTSTIWPGRTARTSPTSSTEMPACYTRPHVAAGSAQSHGAGRRAGCCSAWPWSGCRSGSV